MRTRPQAISSGISSSIGDPSPTFRCWSHAPINAETNRKLMALINVLKANAAAALGPPLPSSSSSGKCPSMALYKKLPWYNPDAIHRIEKRHPSLTAEGMYIKSIRCVTQKEIDADKLTIRKTSYNSTPKSSTWTGGSFLRPSEKNKWMKGISSNIRWSNGGTPNPSLLRWSIWVPSSFSLLSPFIGRSKSSARSSSLEKLEAKLLLQDRFDACQSCRSLRFPRQYGLQLFVIGVGCCTCVLGKWSSQLLFFANGVYADIFAAPRRRRTRNLGIIVDLGCIFAFQISKCRRFKCGWFGLIVFRFQGWIRGKSLWLSC